MTRQFIWNLCRLLVLVILVLVFTPVVIPVGKYDPKLGGLPYSLWMGILVSLILLVLTVIASLYHPGRKD